MDFGARCNTPKGGHVTGWSSFHAYVPHGCDSLVQCFFLRRGSVTGVTSCGNAYDGARQSISRMISQRTSESHGAIAWPGAGRGSSQPSFQARRAVGAEAGLRACTEEHDGAEKAVRSSGTRGADILYAWRRKFGGMDVSDAKRLRQLEQENARLKKVLAEGDLEVEVMKEVVAKKW